MLRFSSFHARFPTKLLGSNKGFVRHHHNQLLFTELDSRNLIRVSGSESFPFLQGLITNDIQNLESHPSIFTLFLNQAGRVLFDSIIYRSPAQNTIFIECDTRVQQTLIRHLKLYRVRRKVQIDDIAGEVKPWVVWDPSHSDIPSGLRSIPTPTLACSGAVDTATHTRPEATTGSQELYVSEDHRGIPDPRVDALGWRLLLPAQQDIKKGTKLNLQKTTESNYRILLYALGIGEGVTDFPIGNSFPLESNVDFLHGVNFHKGCYIGQELTARTHHTGVVRKRLMPFRLTEDFLIPSEVDKSSLQLLNQAGRPVAKVRNIINSYGLALARVEEALASTEIKLGEHPIQLEKPSWWPTEGVTEERQEK